MKLIILDRDGVINEDSDDYIKSPDEWHPIPGSVEAIAALYQAGFHIVVATNQSGLARGLFDIKTLHQIHSKMNALVRQAGGKIEAIFFCPHGPNEGCNCRKPKPGLLLDISVRMNKDLADVFFIGDSYRDIVAAQTAGCKPLLVMTGKGKKTLAEHPEEMKQIPIFENLGAASKLILNNPIKH